MPTTKEMNVSLHDASFFNNKIQEIVRGPQQTHDLDVIRRYFRGYLHCWKTVLHLVREAKLGAGSSKADWIAWVTRWQARLLNPFEIALLEQLRQMRDFDTHSGTLVVEGELAMGLFPLVFINPVKPTHIRRELVTFAPQGLEVIKKLIATYATTP